MKNLLISFLLILCLSNCNKNAFTEHEVEKVWVPAEEQLETYQTLLTAHQSGWEFIMERPNDHGVYYGLINFKNENEIDFLVDYAIRYTKYQPGKINFAVHNGSPSFSFPKYSPFANFIDHAGGLDSLYTFNKIVNDTLFLDGNGVGVKLKLYKCPPEKNQALRNNSMAKNKDDLFKIFSMKRFFFYLNKGGQSFDIALDTLRKEFVINYGTNEDFKAFTSKYYFDQDGIVLQKPFSDSGVEFRKLKPQSQSEFTAIFDEGITITNEPKPKRYNLKIVSDFKGHDAHFGWGSYAGLSTRDQLDIANMRAINEVEFFSIFPTFIIEDEPPVIHGLAAFIMKSGDIALGMDRQLTKFTDDGRVYFERYIVEEHPSSEEINAAKAKITPYFYNERGFYIIGDNNGLYLVDARDGLTWAHFRSLTRMPQ
ncbi:DUF4302 domain-containing protein [Sphingobacterium lactis]|uniref:DUF4302 domain-containing protein n=1 Tax=Sphingobacterium lactis TaxID=797291 RepID=UPI003EC78D75